eukprot:915459-Pleurochrysis_carterae.AAC.1
MNKDAHLKTREAKVVPIAPGREHGQLEDRPAKARAGDMCLASTVLYVERRRSERCERPS